MSYLLITLQTVWQTVCYRVDQNLKIQTKTNQLAIYNIRWVNQTFKTKFKRQSEHYRKTDWPSKWGGWVVQKHKFPRTTENYISIPLSRNPQWIFSSWLCFIIIGR